MIISILLLALSTPSFAKEAVIRFGNSPMYGKEMKIISENRVTNRLRDLEESGGGEDEEFVLACYEGSLDDVCKIVETAVAEENDKEGYRGKDELAMTSCDFAKPHKLFQEGSIIVDIESKRDGKFRFPQLVPCKK